MKFATVFFFCLLVSPIPAVKPLSAQTSADAPAQDLVTINHPAPVLHELVDDPKLHDGELQQTVAVMLERANFPGYSRELWHLEWRKLDPIDLYIIRPQGVARPPVILYLYSYPADTDRFRDDSYCRSVTSRGVAAVGFVSALTGQRYHDRAWKEWFVSDLPEAIGGTTHDVQMILSFLETRSDLDTQKIGMFGQGSGATIAILAAAVDPRIRAVDLLDPWGDWKQWVRQSSLVPEPERAAYETEKFQSRLANLEPLRWLPELSSRSIRLQQTNFNEYVPAAIRQTIAGAMPSGSQVIQYASVDEYMTRAANGGVILEWLRDRLKTP